MLLYQILAYIIHEKIWNSHTKITNLKFLNQCRIKNLNYLISYPVSDIQHYFKYIIKKHEMVTDNPPIRIYVNKIENRVAFRIKTEYFIKLLLGSTKSMITKNENNENVTCLEITEVVVHWNIVNNDYQHDSRVLYTFVPHKSLVNYYIFCL